MSKTILCVDDSKTMQVVCEITFRASDYRYIGATSADEALQKARLSKPALVLADAVMPGKSGYDLCRELKTDPAFADVPVIVMCGNSSGFDEARGSEVGADGHLAKPWDTTQLLDRVGEFIAKGASAVPAIQASARATGSHAAATSPAATARAPAAAGLAPAVAGTPAPRPTPPPRAATPPSVAGPMPAPPAAVHRAGTPPPASRPATALPQPPAGMTRPPMIKGTPSKRPATPVPPPSNAAAARSATLMGVPGVQLPVQGHPTSPKPPGVTSISARGDAQPVADVFAATAPSARQVAERVAAAVPAAALAAARGAALDPSGPEVQALSQLSREVIERVVWEVVPELAETIIRENLDRLAKK